MSQKKTNKTLLFKGLKILLGTVFLMFTGPTLTYIALSNQSKPLFIPLLIIGIVCCLLAIYFMFKGIMTIVDSLFK